MGRPAAELLADPRADTAWIPMTPDEADQAAVALFQRSFPDARVIKEYPTMTTAPEQAPQHDQAEDQVWGQGQTAAPTYPEQPSNPHNHTFTWSPKLPDGSMLVIRAQTAEELVNAVDSLQGRVARLAASWSAAIGSAAPAPQQAPQGPMAPFQAQAQQQFNQQPAQQFPNQPYQGQPAWQQAGAPQQQAPQGPQLPQGWYKLNVPYPQKPVFDGIVAQNNVRKGDPGRGGQVSFQKASKSWYCSPEVAQLFGQFQPVPA
jgi:hypothetical protein